MWKRICERRVRLAEMTYIDEIRIGLNGERGHAVLTNHRGIRTRKEKEENIKHLNITVFFNSTDNV